MNSGSLLGRYEILDRAGSGGMGEVYRARDTQLGRIVAVKILPKESFGDDHLRARFQREARAIAKLTHPHVCAIYDVGETTVAGRDTVQYLVMEHLEGETLESRLKKGALPLTQALKYAIQIAEALEAAHQKHILHRDLKPSNIMLTRAGAKLVDFGIAKLFRDPVPPSWSASIGAGSESDTAALDTGTEEEGALTGEGSIIGTLEYMPPELLEGKDGDARGDIFSFAICLYEMATGRRAFHGPSRAAIIASILRSDPPPVSTYQKRSPPALDWLVRTCLQKDPSERIQTAQDVMLELKRIAEVDLAATPAATAVPATRRTLLLASVLVLAAAAGGLFLYERGSREPEHGSPRRFSVTLPGDTPLSSEVNERFAVSPDGRKLVYVNAAEPGGLYLYSLEKQQGSPIQQTEGGAGPFFSPDGDWVGFYTARGDLKKVSLTAGESVTISHGRELRGASWGKDGTIVFAELRSPLQKISASGGPSEPLPLVEGRANVRWPAFLPDGEHVLFTLADLSGDYDKARLAVLSLKTGVSKIVLNGGTYGRYVDPGYLVYLRSGTLYAVPFSLRTLTTTGQPVLIADDVDSYPTKGLAHFAVSSEGTLFYVPVSGEPGRDVLVAVDRDGNITPLSSVLKAYDEPRLSPDGRRVVVTIGGRPGHESDLWIFDIDANSWTRLATGGGNTTGLWSPDGSEIAFASNRKAGFNVYVVPTDGSGPARRITDRSSWPFPSSWTADGRSVAVTEQFRDRHADVLIQPVNAPGSATPLLSEAYEENFAACSPDGRFIAYQSDESGQSEIYVRRYPRGSEKWMISAGGGTFPVWSKYSREIFYRNDDRVMAVALKPGAQPRFAGPRLLFRGDFQTAFDVYPDGRRFLMVKRSHAPASTRINVVLGLFDYLESRRSVGRAQ